LPSIPNTRTDTGGHQNIFQDCFINRRKPADIIISLFAVAACACRCAVSERQKMKNQRESARHKIMQFLSVSDESGNEVIGNVLDISRSGMRVISELNSFPVGDNKNILIEVLLDDGETQTYTITAQAIWVKLDAEPGYCQIGFRFLKLPDDSEEFLQFIIDND